MSIMMFLFVQILKILNSDIASTRRGVAFLGHMDGFGWSNFSLEMEKEMSGACMPVIRLSNQTEMNCLHPMRIVHVD